jgi:hypothetical protein
MEENKQIRIADIINAIDNQNITPYASVFPHLFELPPVESNRIANEVK